MLSSPEILFAGASVVDTSGGHVDTPQWPGVFGPTGVQEQGVGTRGLLGNLRDPSVSTDISGSGTGIPTPRPTAVRRGRWEQTGRKGGIAKRRQRSAARGTDGSRSVS